MSNRASLGTDLVKGALAGVLGVWALDRVSWFMWNRENPEALAREEKARPHGVDPARLLAYRVARRFGSTAEPQDFNRSATAIHYALGIVPGALYAAWRRRSERVPAAGGLLLGVGVFLLHDELISRLLRLSGPMRAYPWQAHARGLTAHAAFGVATDAALRSMDAAAARL